MFIQNVEIIRSQFNMNPCSLLWRHADRSQRICAIGASSPIVPLHSIRQVFRLGVPADLDEFADMRRDYASTFCLKTRIEHRST
jgi:hypothetical protein